MNQEIRKLWIEETLRQLYAEAGHDERRKIRGEWIALALDAAEAYESAMEWGNDSEAQRMHEQLQAWDALLAFAGEIEDMDEAEQEILQ